MLKSMKMSWAISATFFFLLSSNVSAFMFQKPQLQSVPVLKFIRQMDNIPANTVGIEPTTTPTPPQTPDCSGTCQFSNGVASQPLMSCNGSCVCSAKPGVPTSWNVIWNGTICTISESGPCGKGEKAMVMECQPGLQCIEKRCREPSRIGTLEVGWACDDSLDCQGGLACVSEENTVPFHKTCRVLPKSLFRIW